MWYFGLIPLVFHPHGRSQEGRRQVERSPRRSRVSPQTSSSSLQLSPPPWCIYHGLQIWWCHAGVAPPYPFSAIFIRWPIVPTPPWQGPFPSSANCPLRNYRGISSVRVYPVGCIDPFSIRRLDAPLILVAETAEMSNSFRTQDIVMGCIIMRNSVLLLWCSGVARSLVLAGHVPGQALVSEPDPRLARPGLRYATALMSLKLPATGGNVICYRQCTQEQPTRTFYFVCTIQWLDLPSPWTCPINHYVHLPPSFTCLLYTPLLY